MVVVEMVNRYFSTLANATRAVRTGEPISRQEFLAISAAAAGGLTTTAILAGCAGPSGGELTPQADVNTTTIKEISGLLGIAEGMTAPQIKQVAYDKSVTDKDWARNFFNTTFTFTNLDGENFLVYFGTNGEPIFRLPKEKKPRIYVFSPITERAFRENEGNNELVIIGSQGVIDRLGKKKEKFKLFLNEYTSEFNTPVTLYLVLDPQLNRTVGSYNDKQGITHPIILPNGATATTLPQYSDGKPAVGQQIKPDRLHIALHLPELFKFALNRWTFGDSSTLQKEAIIREIIGALANEWANAAPLDTSNTVVEISELFSSYFELLLTNSPALASTVLGTSHRDVFGSLAEELLTMPKTKKGY